jgi:hypothetical protein
MENKIDAYINRLLLTFGIPLSKIYFFKKEHGEEIEKSMDMFKLNYDEDAQRCFALLHVLSFGKLPEAVVDYFRRENGFSNAFNEKAFEADKASIITALIAALVYNPRFFTVSCNVYGMIRYKVANKISVPVKDKERKLPRKVTVTGREGPALKLVRNDSYTRFQEPIWREKVAASGVNMGLVEFNKPIKIKEEGELGELGELRILGDKNRLQFRFTFAQYPFKEDGTPPETAPYKIALLFTTGKGEKEELDVLLGNLDVNNPRHEEMVISSNVIANVDYTGIALLGRKNVPWEQNNE